VVWGKGRVRRELRAEVAQGEGRLIGSEPPASTKLDCRCTSKSVAGVGGVNVHTTVRYCSLLANARGSTRQLVVWGKGRVRKELRAEVAQEVEGRLIGSEPPAGLQMQKKAAVIDGG
jgi:cytoskeletal protein CcmA (bactofilin family)